MIKTVIKRDGREQEFDADKLNKWANWASEKCGVSWSEIVLGISPFLQDRMKSEDVQDLLIDECLKQRTSAHTQMAARLLLGKIYKEAYGCFKVPTLKDFYHKAVANGWWADLGYEDKKLEALEEYIDHSKDFTYSYATLKQFYDKYAVDVGFKAESPQMAFMGLAMASMKDEPEDNRLEDIAATYKHLSDLNINLPTPTLGGLRTPLTGSPSCCVISAKDETESIGAALHSAFRYTAARAGIGIEFDTRAPKEPVKGGRVEHGGKYSIYNNLQTSVNTLTQIIRGGNATVTYTCLDPEVLDLLTMKQQRTADAYRIDHLDYSLAVNNAFLKRVARNEDWYLVSSHFAPELHRAFYSGDEELFEKEYAKVVESKSKWVKKVKARDIVSKFITARAETGRNYLFFVDNANKHTPFKDPIRLSNLCQEIELPTEGYNNVSDLFSENENGETGLCFLGSLVAKDYTDEEYEELAYYVAKIIDNTIDSSEYPFPQVEYTAKNRRSIGVGITNLAHLMAKNGVKYDTEEGRNFVHKVAERHSYFMHKASTRLAKERGKCGWIHKTKYNEGWLPIDTYSKGVDKWHTQELQYDWEALRGEIKEHGVRFSVLEAFMPTESSSLLTNSTAGLYGVRSLDIFKQSRKGGVYFQVPEIDELKDNYQFVWDVDNLDWAKFYGIVQKFCGQGISADFYHDFGKQPSVSANDMIKLMLLSAQVGMKSWYYLNFKVQASSTTGLTIDDEENCDSCTL